MNKTIVITGATGGIGQIVVTKLSSEKVNLVLIGRDLVKLKNLQKEFKQVSIFRLNIEDSKKVNLVTKQIIKKFKVVDVLINIAGILGPIGEFHTQNLSEWKNVINANLFGTINFCHAILPFMVKRKQGKIINFSGGGAVKPFINFSAYASSKTAVVRFTENIAQEYKKYNIQINAIAPGLINTHMLDSALKAGSKKAGAEYYNRVVNAKTLGGDDVNKAIELINWLIKPTNKLTGKLIAAQWDNFLSLTGKQIKELNENSGFTLRRIDNKNFKELI